MGSFLTALTSVADQYGAASNSAREEKAARADKLRQLDAQDAYLQIARQAEARAAEAQKAAIARGDLHQLGDRLWSVSKNKFVDPEPIDPTNHLKELIGTLDPETAKGAIARFRAEYDPLHPKAVFGEVFRYIDESQKEKRLEAQRQKDAAIRHQEHEEDVSTATANRRQDWKEHRKEMEGFQRSMVPYRLAETQESKGKELTPAAAKIVETTQPTIQQVDRLIGDIDKLGLQNNNQAGYLFGSRLKYAIGMASPEGTLADDIAGLSLGSVIEAGSAMQGTSRSLVALKKALVHTPNAWKDSPMLMRRKLVEIRQRLNDMMADANKYGTKGATPGAGGSTGGAPDATNADPLGVLK